MIKRIDELQEGDLVDLEGDQYADPDRSHEEFEFPYLQVLEIVHETPNCICVYFDGFTCGFPPDHNVTVKDKE